MNITSNINLIKQPIGILKTQVPICFAGKKKRADSFISSQKLSPKDIQKLKKEMNKFPQDIQYRKKLLIDAGINPSEFYKIRTIIGFQELRAVIKEYSDNRENYSPGARPAGREFVSDSHGVENVKSGKFSANFHIHSNISDGEMSVQEILDNANEYAEYLKKIKNKPFYIAITDHNSINAPKIALEIIRKNPKKYENLRLVLGSEITLKMNSIDEFELKKPQTIHLLDMCINPFDKKLNEFFNELTNGKNNPMNPKKIILQDAMKILSQQKYSSFSLAHPAWPYLPTIMKKPEAYLDAAKKYIEVFARCASDKLLSIENYYQSYDDEIARDVGLLKTIENTTKNMGICSSGGMDTHGKRIYYCDSRKQKGLH